MSRQKINLFLKEKKTLLYFFDVHIKGRAINMFSFFNLKICTCLEKQTKEQKKVSVSLEV